jgi:hypothetical protein
VRHSSRAADTLAGLAAQELVYALAKGQCRCELPSAEQPTFRTHGWRLSHNHADTYYIGACSYRSYMLSYRAVVHQSVLPYNAYRAVVYHTVRVARVHLGTQVPRRIRTQVPAPWPSGAHFRLRITRPTQGRLLRGQVPQPGWWGSAAALWDPDVIMRTLNRGSLFMDSGNGADATARGDEGRQAGHGASKR